LDYSATGPVAPISRKKYVTVKIVQHIGDDLLVRYAVQALLESDVIPLEEQRFVDDATAHGHVGG
jgi:hypothetical protein